MSVATYIGEEYELRGDVPRQWTRDELEWRTAEFARLTGLPARDLAVEQYATSEISPRDVERLMAGGCSFAVAARILL